MTTAFVFVGQGVQKVGMVADLIDNREFFEIFNKIPKDIQDLCVNGPAEELNDTRNAQLAIVATSLGIANILNSKNIKCDYVAGLSLGEYSALSYSGVINMSDVFDIVQKRGEIMSRELLNKNTGMLAVLNSDIATINEVIKELNNLDIANYNSPKQIVLTGSLESIELAINKFSDLKIRTIKLNVSGAFHSKYLENASLEFHNFLKQYSFNKQKYTVVFNSEGEPSSDDIKNLMTKQMKSSVKFMQSIEYMVANGVKTFVEVGPGKVLSGLIRQIDKNVKVYSVDSLSAIEKLERELNG